MQLKQWMFKYCFLFLLHVQKKICPVNVGRLTNIDGLARKKIPALMAGISKSMFNDAYLPAAKSLLIIFNAPPALNHSICCSL